MYSKGNKQDDDNSSQVCYLITKSPQQLHHSTIIHIWPAHADILYCYCTLQKHHVIFVVFSSEMIILWVRTKNPEQLTEENNTSRNNTSNIITHCWYECFFATRRNEKQLWENTANGNKKHILQIFKVFRDNIHVAAEQKTAFCLNQLAPGINSLSTFHFSVSIL